MGLRSLCLKVGYLFWIQANEYIMVNKKYYQSDKFILFLFLIKNCWKSHNAHSDISILALVWNYLELIILFWNVNLDFSSWIMSFSRISYVISLRSAYAALIGNTILWHWFLIMRYDKYFNEMSSTLWGILYSICSLVSRISIGTIFNANCTPLYEHLNVLPFDPDLINSIFTFSNISLISISC